uniref:Uncharacterized protein n=2 Tax=Oncorhynchus TaxID=8016 RepID=A0A8C8IXF3_ONCTS
MSYSSSRSSSRNTDCKVYVGDLGNGAAKGELERAFSYYGPLRSVWVARNPPGFAFVEYEDPRDAEDATKGMDGKVLCGARIRVELSTGMSRKSRHDRPSRRHFDPNDRCYQCGENGHYAYDCYRFSKRGGGRRSRSRSRSRSRGRRYRSRSRSNGRDRFEFPYLPPLGVINPHHTQSAKTDLGPQHVPSPEVQCAGRPEVQCAGRPEVQCAGRPEVQCAGRPEVQCAGRPEVQCAGRPEVQCAGRPEVQCAEQQVAPDLAPAPGPCPAPGRAASPDLAPGPSPAQPPPRGTVDPGLRARGKAPLLMPTDHGGETAPCPLLFRCPCLPRGLKPFYTLVYVFDFFLLSFF